MFPFTVKIVEVGARDGLQNEKQTVSTADKIEFLHQLSETGLQVIEATSFVSPKWVPQLADHSEVFQALNVLTDISYPVLVPNALGLENALAVGVKEIAVFTTPSEQFSQHNTNCSVAESLSRIEDIVWLAKKNHVKVRAYLSCVLGCPYEGKIAPQAVADLAKKLLDLGCYEISLGDTIGVGTPLLATQLIDVVAKVIPLENIAVHFHDTYGQALANIYAVLQQGVRIVDSSVAGLGGCPYAKGASGNVATEDVVYMLQGMQIETGVDLEKLIAVGQFITDKLQRKSQSKVAIAHTSS